MNLYLLISEKNKFLLIFNIWFLWMKSYTNSDFPYIMFLFTKYQITSTLLSIFEDLTIFVMSF